MFVAANSKSIFDIGMMLGEEKVSVYYDQCLKTLWTQNMEKTFILDRKEGSYEILNKNLFLEAFLI